MESLAYEQVLKNLTSFYLESLLCRLPLLHGVEQGSLSNIDHEKNVIEENVVDDDDNGLDECYYFGKDNDNNSD